MTLTKAELLQGAGARRTVPIEALKGDVTLRPLTDFEFHRVQMMFINALGLQLDLSGSDLQMGKADLADKLKANFDLEKFAEAEYEMNLLAAAYGLSNREEKWTPAEVGHLPAGVPEQIAQEVFDLSGANPQQEALLRNFRVDESGGGLRAVTDDGSAAGEDAGGPDTGAADSAGGASEATIYTGEAAG